MPTATTPKKTRSSRSKATRPGTKISRTTKTRPVMAEDLTRFRMISSPMVSPDGSRLVFVSKKVGTKNDYVSDLWLAAADGSEEPRQFTSSGKASQPFWSPDARSIAFVSNEDEGKPQVHVISVDGGEARKLTDLPAGSIRALLWSPAGDHFAIAWRPTLEERTKAAAEQRKEQGLSDPPWVIDDWWYRLDGDGYFGSARYGLYIVDAKSGEHRLLYDRDRMGYFDFDFSPDGRRVVVASNEDRQAMIKPWKTMLRIIDLKSRKATTLPDQFAGPKSSPKWSPDGKTIAFAGREGTDGDYSVENLELWVCDPAKGRMKSLTAEADYCLMAPAMSDTAEIAFAPNVQWSGDSARVFMTLGWQGAMHLASVPRGGGRVELHTRGAAVWNLGNVSRDGVTIGLTCATPTKLTEACVGVMKSGKVQTRQVSRQNAAVLSELQLSEPQDTWAETADGTKVHVWLMFPPGFKKGSRKKLPAVLEIHGGPHGQYGIGYFHEMQLLAAQGYLVVFSNPRGSKGYGREHCAAIRGRWGTADWVDIQAVIQLMKQHPNVNPKRMAVMGGSYGGYMTNWTIGNTNDFACAITDRCVSNLVSMAGNSDFIEAPDDYFPGNFWDRPEPRWEQSPIRLMGNAKTPTLIIHSEGDLRCNIEQGEQVFAALKLNNVPCRFVRYPRSTSHGMSRGGPPDMRLHRLDQITDWLGKYLK